MRAILVGYGSEKSEAKRMLQRLGCEAECDVQPDGEPGVVLVRNLCTLDEIKPYVKSLHSIFVQQYSLETPALVALSKLADEAGVVVQFAATSFYEWRLAELMPIVGEVKLVQMYKDVEHRAALAVQGLHDEWLCTLACVQSRLSRVELQRTISSEMSAVLGFRLSFESAASAYFWTSSNAIRYRHELRMYGSRGLAQVSMAATRTLLKTPDDVVEEWTFLTRREAIEKELADFIGHAQAKTQPAIALASQIDLQRIFHNS